MKMFLFTFKVISLDIGWDTNALDRRNQFKNGREGEEEIRRERK
jgi:hypothetical protein